MKALILAAGRGRRMRKLTQDIPKCLVKLKGKTLLQRHIDILTQAGIKEIGIVTGYKKEKIKSFGLKEFFNESWSSTNMVTSMECAYEWFESSTVLVCYSDIFYEVDAINYLKKSEYPISITYDPNWHVIWKKRFKNPLEDAETFLINEHNEILEIGKKTNDIKKIQGQFMGLIKIKKEGWELIKNFRKSLNNLDKNKMDMTSLLNLMIKKDKFFLKGVPFNGVWGEIDSEKDLNIYES